MADDDEQAGGEQPDVKQAFAALMNDAAQAAAPDAPYGYTTDRVTGERRPKKTAGRPRATPPGASELREAAAAAEPPGPDEPDVAPQRPRGAAPATPDQPAAAYVPGQIARGINKLYRRAGKIARAMDHDVGTALISITRKDDDDDVTVGEGWEELARTNPRIRGFCLRIIAGGAWSQLIMVHAPVGMAIVMKPAILSHLPFRGLVESLAEPDDDDGSQPALLDGLEPGDLAQMMDLAESMLGRAAAAAGPQLPRGHGPQAAAPGRRKVHTGGPGHRRKAS